MVEMLETATILHNATPRSLILLDEIGRGTSTFDGLSIAWAVAEYLHENEGVRAKTLFATHYHELTELALTLPRIKNYHVAVQEWKDEVVFLRKIVPGPSDQSYGIHVAQLAGLPRDGHRPGPGDPLQPGESGAGRRRAAAAGLRQGRRGRTGSADVAVRGGPRDAGLGRRSGRRWRAATSRPDPPRGAESIGPAGRAAASVVFFFAPRPRILVIVLVVVVVSSSSSSLVLVVGSFAVLFLALLDGRLELVLVLVAAEAVGGGVAVDELEVVSSIWQKTDMLWPVCRLPTVSTTSAFFLIASSVSQLEISISSMI